MSWSKLNVFLLLIFLSCGISVAVKCFYCGVFISPRYFSDDQIYCDHPAQWTCPNPYDSCISLIYDNLMLKRCLTLRDPKTQFLMWMCNQTRAINERNCRICSSNLCNSGRSHQVNAETLVLLVSCIVVSYFWTLVLQT